MLDLVYCCCCRSAMSLARWGDPEYTGWCREIFSGARDQARSPLKTTHCHAHCITNIVVAFVIHSFFAACIALPNIVIVSRQKINGKDEHLRTGRSPNRWYPSVDTTGLACREVNTMRHELGMTASKRRVENEWVHTIH